MAGGDGRMPKEMKELLKLCASATDPNNPSANTSFHNLDEEDKEFLERALDASTTNPVVEIKRSIDFVKQSVEDADTIIENLENLQDWCGQIDFATDFHKVGGFEIFEKCISHEDEEVRWQLLELVATLSQNNPYCQQVLLQDPVLNLEKLLDVLDNDPSETVRTKALYAISCLIRENEAGIEQFIQHNGFSFLMRAMQTSVEKLKIKSAFLLSVITTDNERIKDILCDMGMIEQLIGLLNEGHSGFHEHLMSALLTIVKDHSRSLGECLRPEFDLISLLQTRKTELEGKEQFREEREYTEELLQLLTDSETDYDVPR